MHCIFCQLVSDDSRSEEHIIPESLGNTDHILPRGWVCDRCNNYMSRKLEKPFLDSLHLIEARFTLAVPNKKGRIPSMPGLHPKSRTRLELFHLPDGQGIGVGATGDEDPTRWVKFLANENTGRIYMPHAPLPESRPVVARFVGKVGLEASAHRLLSIPGANAELAFKNELEELRNFVRWNRNRGTWPISIRRIYSEDCGFLSEDGSPYQVLHEFDILVTPEGEYYIALAVFGVEYVMNLGGPELDGFEKWLKENNNVSPLYAVEGRDVRAERA
jgi:HNH endonuclease